MGNIRFYLSDPLQYVWKLGSKMFKGAAIKLFQHTQQPCEMLLCNIWVHAVWGKNLQ
jgi:hypothetical protein